MMMDVDQAAKAMNDAGIEDLLEDFNQLTYRGMRVNGVRVATWSSRDFRGQPAGSSNQAEHEREGPTGQISCRACRIQHARAAAESMLIRRRRPPLAPDPGRCATREGGAACCRG